MNAEEGVSLAKMAVTVLLVVLIIGAVVAIVYAAYSWFTSGSDKLTDQVVSIDKSSFSQYDDQTVSGTDVLSAMKSYRESEICIFVSNLKNQGGTYDATATSLGAVPNYCALTSDAKGATNTSGSSITVNGVEIPTSALTQNNGQWQIANAGLQWNSNTNQTERNTNFSPTTTNSNTDCYVKSSAKWYANLVYDPSTGEICGILFRQMS